MHKVIKNSQISPYDMLQLKELPNNTRHFQIFRICLTGSYAAIMKHLSLNLSFTSFILLSKFVTFRSLAYNGEINDTFNLLGKIYPWIGTYRAVTHMSLVLLISPIIAMFEVSQ